MWPFRKKQAKPSPKPSEINHRPGYGGQRSYAPAPSRDGGMDALNTVLLAQMMDNSQSSPDPSPSSSCGSYYDSGPSSSYDSGSSYDGGGSCDGGGGGGGD